MRAKKTAVGGSLMLAPAVYDYCPHCAGDLRVEVCERCSYALPLDARFCPGCGAEARPEPAKPEPIPMTEKRPNRTPDKAERASATVQVSSRDLVWIKHQAYQQQKSYSQFLEEVTLAALGLHPAGELPTAAREGQGRENAWFQLAPEALSEIRERSPQGYSGFIRWAIYQKMHGGKNES